MEQIIEIVNRIFEEEFEIEPELLKPEALLNEDLELDSLDAVDLIVMFDQELEVRINEEEARELKTLEDVYNTIYKLKKPKLMAI
jgi:acyl carrier protein